MGKYLGKQRAQRACVMVIMVVLEKRAGMEWADHQEQENVCFNGNR